MGSFTWTAACIYRETADAVTIVFDQGENLFSFNAGQFINLTLTINNEQVTRAYSLSSCPGDDERPSITIKQVDDGLMSTFILNHADEIREWEIDGPHGFFYPTEATLNAKWVVLIGGGSGITPLYSILKSLIRSTTISILLINSNKKKDDIIFRRALTNMQQSFSHRLQVVNVFTKELPADISVLGEVIEGRLTRIRLKKIIKQYAGDHFSNAHYFMCGPNGLLQLTAETMQSLEIPSAQIFKEIFHPSNDDATIELPTIVHEVLLHHYERTNLLEIIPGKTILDVALDDHVPVQYSCKNGTCVICIGKLTSGNVHMKQNYNKSGGDTVNVTLYLLTSKHQITKKQIVETLNESGVL